MPAATLNVNDVFNIRTNATKLGDFAAAARECFD